MSHEHRVWAEVRLDNLCHNVRIAQASVGRGTRLMAVVKADAYGVGAIPFSRALQDAGVRAFGVGDSSEALELREAGIDGTVLVLGTVIPGEIERVVARDVSVCIHSESRLDSLVAEARRQAIRARVHLKVDTGMGRLGVLPSRALALARKIADFPELIFEGVATHLAGTTSAADPANEVQLERFLEVREAVLREGLGEPLFHASASAGAFSQMACNLDMVRCGLALHGIPPPHATGPARELRPVLSLRSQVVFLKDVPPGTQIGYQRRYQSEKATRIATIPAGYNDCLPVRLSGRGHALVRGQAAPFVGAISMDYATLDVGLIPGVCVGDVVTLVGTERSSGMESTPEVRLEHLAHWAGTIPYEILCSLGKRVVRLYHGAPNRAVERTAAS